MGPHFANRFVAACGAALLELACGSAGADAGTVRVAPVTLDLPAGRHAGQLMLTNPEDHPVNVQLRVFRWTQERGEDRLSATDDVVASPPIATLAPGAQQLVRIVRVLPADAAAEESYRILVDEIPDPASIRSNQVTLVLRQSLPVFFDDHPQPAGEVAWRIETTTEGSRLVAENRGGRRLRISEVALLGQSGETLWRQSGLLGYVLAGESRAWRLPPGARAAARLSGTSDQGPLDVELEPTSGR